MNEFGGVLFEAPEPMDRLVARGLAVAISTIFAFAAPFAWIPLVRIPMFIPLYESAVVINDLVTAAVFAVLFAIRGRRGLLFLAAGYLWTALSAVAHLLSFPGFLTPTGLWAGPQTTARLYAVWHIGFPAAVILYGVAGRPVIRSRTRALLIAGLAVAVTVAGLFVLSTSGRGLLPPIMDSDRESAWARLTAGGICLAAALAMSCVLANGPYGGRTRLDLWLSVAAYAWIGDFALSAVFNAGRFDVGFYAGRFFGFLAVSFVLYHMLLLAAVDHYRHAR